MRARAQPTPLSIDAAALVDDKGEAMKTWYKVVLITLGTAVPAFILGPIIWPPDPHGAAPVGLQLVLFIVLAAIESLALGLGVAFISYGVPLVRRAGSGSRASAWMTFIATAWLLISWWPHDNMHKHNGMNLGGLLVIEYLFHFSMIVAGVILAYTLVRALRATTTTEQALSERIAHGTMAD
jgi:hypothetical protein